MAAGELTQTDTGQGAHAAPDPSHTARRRARGARTAARFSGHGPGRVSARVEFDVAEPSTLPSPAVKLTRLDEALTLVSRHAELRSRSTSVIFGEDSHAGAQRLHGPARRGRRRLGARGGRPAARNVDIVTGPEAPTAAGRPGLQARVMSMVASSGGRPRRRPAQRPAQLSTRPEVPHHSH